MNKEQKKNGCLSTILRQCKDICKYEEVCIYFEKDGDPCYRQIGDGASCCPVILKVIETKSDEYADERCDCCEFLPSKLKKEEKP